MTTALTVINERLVPNIYEMNHKGLRLVKIMIVACVSD